MTVCRLFSLLPAKSHFDWLIDWWLLIWRYSPLSWAGSLHSHMILHEWLAFYSAFLNINQSGVLTALAWLVPHETAAVSAQVLCIPYNHAPCHFMQSHIRKVYACSAVTCHLHFGQNDRDLLCATAVTVGWNRYRNKSQHKKSTLEKTILPPLLQEFKPTTFQSWVWHSNRWAIPTPMVYIMVTILKNAACIDLACIHQLPCAKTFLFQMF